MQGDGSETRKIITLEKEFRKVIEKCTPGAPVAVLAIAGKANKGKSLFLSFVLRYLHALKNGQHNADWMGWKDTEERPLQDGFKWENGYEVVTKGIWTWSEPICLKNSNGQNFDVLLLDTQGVFDEETGQREWNILAGLALLTSSVMILNTSNDVQEDTLELLQNSLSFGLLALDREKSPEAAGKPFQNLVFLVRDWENHQQFPFGNQGGREFIERKLQEKPKQDESHRRLRKQMKECFESIDCFLFPHPGIAVRESSFTGSVVNASKEYRLFAQHVQQCVEQLLNPDHFPLKTLNGNFLTGRDVLEMFKSHVEIFNSDQLPSSSDLFNAAAHRCNAMIITRCVTAFVQTFESSLSSVPFLSTQEFAKTQKTAEKEARTLFQTSRKMGDSKVIDAARSELKTKLDERIAYFMAVNQNNRTDACKKLEEKVKEILREYEAELESKVDDHILYEEAFNDIHRNAVSNLRQKFQDLQIHPCLEPQGLAMLDGPIKNVDRWLDRVKMNREMAEQSFLTVKDTSAMEYWNALNSPNFTDLKELEQAEAKARSRALRALDDFPRKLDRAMFEKVKNDLTAQLDGMYEKTGGQLKKNLSLEGDQAKVQVAIEDAVRQYRNSMEGQSDTPRLADGLADVHGQCESKALKYLSEFLEKEKLYNAKQLEQQSKAQLQVRISQEFSNFQRRNDQKSRTLKVQMSKSLSDAQQQFNDELKQIAEGTKDSASFTSKATDLKNRVKAKARKLTAGSILDDTDLTEQLSAMESYMDNLITVNVKVVDAKRKENEAAARAKKQTEELKQRMESMEKESKDRQKQLLDANKAQKEAEETKKRLELLEKELEAERNKGFFKKLIGLLGF